MDRFDDIQTALKPLKKIELHFYDHFNPIPPMQDFVIGTPKG